MEAYIMGDIGGLTGSYICPECGEKVESGLFSTVEHSKKHLTNPGWDDFCTNLWKEMADKIEPMHDAVVVAAMTRRLMSSGGLPEAKKYLEGLNGRIIGGKRSLEEFRLLCG